MVTDTAATKAGPQAVVSSFEWWRRRAPEMLTRQTWQEERLSDGNIRGASSGQSMQRTLHPARGQLWVVDANVALTKSLKDQCPPALNGAARDTCSPAL